MKHKHEQTTLPAEIVRAEPDWHLGLTGAQVQQRIDAGAHNEPPKGVTPTVGRIVLKNVCTLFNLINFLLALAVLLVGHPKNALFFGVAICNTAMGIIQELRAKRTLDKLSVLAKGAVTAVRNGQSVQIEHEQVVLDDILLLAPGNQICADGVIVHAEGLEVDEALLTGEADRVIKADGAQVFSGSYVTAGRAYMRVTAVGKHSYANTLTAEAKKEKRTTTPLMRTLNRIILVLTIAIVPVGALLFYSQYTNSGSLDTSVLGSTAAVIGMIPEGLILLTGVTLTVGAMRLAKRKALVQTLPSIETLARVDVLCLDKTGTITDGTLTMEQVIPIGDFTEAQARTALCALNNTVQDENTTAIALRKALAPEASTLHLIAAPDTADPAAPPCGEAWQPTARVPFSSERKWSGANFAGVGCYVMGAPAFVFPEGGAFMQMVDDYATQGYRVLCLAHSSQPLVNTSLPAGLNCVALVVLSDTVRAEAPETFRFFENEGVTLKVISGDDPLTVSAIAGRAGITGYENYIDLSKCGPETDYRALVEQYTVFGRVLPQQKKDLIRALRQNGHTACMTGDGVNDVLAMKEASCSVAMINGSDAARGACDFVLMTSDFSTLVDVLREGRRVINNIENVASLYLVKTIYSTVLSLLYIFIPHPYPFAPLQMTPINALTVGIPSFFLAMRDNAAKPEGRFVAGVLENSLPAALTIIFNILVVQFAGFAFGLTQTETSTMNVLLTGAVGFILLARLAQPFRTQEKALLGGMIMAFLLVFLIAGEFFMLGSLFTRNVFFYLPLLYTSTRMFSYLTQAVRRVEAWLLHRREQPPHQSNSTL